MNMTFGGITRTVALWVMIICAAIADAVLWWRWHVAVDPVIKTALLFWASFWLVIAMLVIAYEIFALITKRKTISTMWKEWLIKEPLIGYPVTILLWTALNALFVHLIFW